MPVLNIQRDVEKLKKDPDRSLGENIIYYLTELTIFVNSQCSLQCDFCRKATRQFPCCTSRNDDSSLSIAILQSIAKQIQIIPGITLNIFGGNIFQYPELQQLPNLFPEKNIRYWFHYSNYQNTTIESIAQFNILIDFPVKRANLFSCIDQLPKEKTKLHFIVSSVEDVESAQSIINERSIEKIELHPLYSEDSKLFFEENVFLNQDDITSETISQRKIFCNQTLNANFFGKLTILPNGDVCANPNSEKLGSMQEDTILKLIYKELDTNTAWRKIRTEKPCNKCLYQYLCPPPSNYEYVIGRPNLCHL